MSERSHKRSSWLSQAQMQSRRLAETRAAMAPGLDWSRLEGGGQKTRRPLSRARRLSWAVPMLVLLLVGGATGTWAYVRHVKAKKTAAAPEEVKPTQVKAKSKRKRGPVRRTVVKKPAVAPVAVKEQPKPKPRRRGRARPAAKKPQPVKPAVTPNREEIIYGEGEIRGGELIIVSPPAKLKPLWTPEEFSKRGPRRP